mmetsp:Transcript_17030/g.20630  ORF Transcript_17030/g.20630 Transcript_17030/m.20630 type:complete len:421 (-) Transcript_17030:780-2042(-)
MSLRPKESVSLLQKGPTGLNKAKISKYERENRAWCTTTRGIVIAFGAFSIAATLLLLPNASSLHQTANLDFAYADDERDEISSDVSFSSASSGKSDHMESNLKKEDATFIDRWWAGDRKYQKVKAYLNEISEFCEDVVAKDPKEFEYNGEPSDGHIHDSLVLSTHHKTGTHLLRNIANMIFMAADMKPKHVGFCGFIKMNAGNTWANKLQMWCSRGGKRFRSVEQGYDYRMVQLMRHPRKMLISQHLYQTALATSKQHYSDQVDRKKSLFYIGLRKKNTHMMWMGTFDKMIPIIDDMIDQMNQTIGNKNIVTLDMEDHFFVDFDKTVKTIFDHLLMDRVTPQQRCELRVEASFQDTQRFGDQVDRSHANTHVAPQSKKEIAIEELDQFLQLEEEETKAYREKYAQWLKIYKEYTDILWLK